MKAGALPLFVSMLKYHDTEEQICAATALWTLSFDTTSRDLIKEEPGCIEALQNLQKSDDPKVRKEADGALWVIMEKDSGRIGKIKFDIHRVILCRIMYTKILTMNVR